MAHGVQIAHSNYHIHKRPLFPYKIKDSKQAPFVKDQKREMERREERSGWEGRRRERRGEERREIGCAGELLTLANIRQS